MRSFYRAIFLGIIVVLPQHGFAVDAPGRAAGELSLVSNDRAQVTREDYDADLQRVPADIRGEFGNDPHRIQQLLTNLITVKTLAADARARGLDRDPLVERRLLLESDRLLAQLELERVEKAAGAEFDAKSKDFETRALETYRVDEAKHRVPETVSVAHILLDPKKHGGPDATAALAREIRSKAITGDFGALATQYSDDPTVSVNKGKLGSRAANELDPAFAKAAFALQQPGEISEPVQSSFGIHIIKLEGRQPSRLRPFPEVKADIMAELRRRFITERREQKLASIRSGSMKVNQPAVDALVNQVDPALLKPRTTIPGDK